jgi:RNA polymerase sigma-70 factor, ECF subfamily
MTKRSPEDTSSSLLARARKHDEVAWLRLAEWIGPFILAWCRRFSLQDADCAEVAQNVLVRVWRALADFRKEKPGDSFRAWVRTITANGCRDFLRTKRRRPAAGPLGEHPGPPEPEDDPREIQDMKRRALHLLVRDLMARHAEDRGFLAFYRTQVDGLSTADAARELGLSDAAVRQHKCRWTARLREQLRDEFEGLLE